jgi:hypothetical protein
MVQKVLIEVIDHKAQRYLTTGDWQFKSSKDASLDASLATDFLHIRVSDTGDYRSNMLVALHEFVEAILCWVHGIDGRVVDAWDMGPGQYMEEPGNNPSAPYHREHCVADIVERLVAMHMITWQNHELNIERLYDDRNAGTTRSASQA